METNKIDLEQAFFDTLRRTGQLSSVDLAKFQELDGEGRTVTVQTPYSDEQRRILFAYLFRVECALKFLGIIETVQAGRRAETILQSELKK